MRKTTLIIASLFCFIGWTNAQLMAVAGNNKNTKTARKAEPATSYAFNQKIEMQMTSEKDVILINYFLPTTGNFICAEVVDEKKKDEMYTVFDLDQEAMFTYMNNAGSKIRMGIKFRLDDAEDESPYTITATGNTKVILGYNCSEYLVVGEDMTGNVWVTTEADVRFPSSFYNIKQNKSANQKWMKDVEGWAMEMEMTDTSKKKPKTFTMNCLSIEKFDFTLNSNEYQKMGL